MTLTTATQDEVAELTRHCGMAHRSLQRARDGGMHFPMTDVDRNRLLNQLNAISQDLEILGIIAEGAPALGPNDVVIDSTLPVPVRDLDTGVLGMAHVTLEAGADPLIGFTGEEVSLVKAGTQIMLGRPAGLPAAPAVIATGNPLATTADVNDRTVVGRVGDAAIMQNTLGTPHEATVVGYNAQGKIKVEMASTAYAGVIANGETAGMRSYYEIGTKAGATGRIQINDQKLNFFSTGPLCYPLVHNETLTDPITGSKYRFEIDKGRITSITPVP